MKKNSTTEVGQNKYPQSDKGNISSNCKTDDCGFSFERHYLYRRHAVQCDF